MFLCIKNRGLPGCNGGHRFVKLHDNGITLRDHGSALAGVIITDLDFGLERLGRGVDEPVDTGCDKAFMHQFDFWAERYRVCLCIDGGNIDRRAFGNAKAGGAAR